ncbi:hypothetical protein L6164_028696 [Bauhinia variegata]|uniref:Uncharacterized protein n=1 Tax=Bauhinia variegata TaxID=167791 RepID=A0ACB9L703_BAUVA|nr:hypothetical protein L6164_028696 [Bauhinia variegata]
MHECFGLKGTQRNHGTVFCFHKNEEDGQSVPVTAYHGKWETHQYSIPDGDEAGIEEVGRAGDLALKGLQSQIVFQFWASLRMPIGVSVTLRRRWNERWNWPIQI